MTSAPEPYAAQPDGTEEAPEPPRQPWLHDLTLVLAAPTQVWSGADGQVRPGGMHGVLHSDRRLLDRLVLLVDGHEPQPVARHERRW